MLPSPVSGPPDPRVWGQFIFIPGPCQTHVFLHLSQSGRLIHLPSLQDEWQPPDRKGGIESTVGGLVKWYKCMENSMEVPQSIKNRII